MSRQRRGIGAAILILSVFFSFAVGLILGALESAAVLEKLGAVIMTAVILAELLLLQFIRAYIKSSR